MGIVLVRLRAERSTPVLFPVSCAPHERQTEREASKPTGRCAEELVMPLLVSGSSPIHLSGLRGLRRSADGGCAWLGGIGLWRNLLVGPPVLFMLLSSVN